MERLETGHKVDACEASGLVILSCQAFKERSFTFRGKVSFFISSWVKAKSSKMSRQNGGDKKPCPKTLWQEVSEEGVPKSLKGFNRKVMHSGALKGKVKVKAKREKGKRQKKNEMKGEDAEFQTSCSPYCYQSVPNLMWLSSIVGRFLVSTCDACITCTPCKRAASPLKGWKLLFFFNPSTMVALNQKHIRRSGATTAQDAGGLQGVPD